MTTESIVKSLELDRFSNNAAELLIQRGQVEKFFEHIGYEAKSHQEGYRGMCPACLSSFCFIGLNGKHHRLFWKCFDHRCPSQKKGSGFRRNLLGLVKGVSTDQSLGTAIKVIAEFLGFAGRSFDITNGKYGDAPVER